MHIISRKRLRGFWTTVKEAEAALDAWYRIVRGIHPKNLTELQATFSSADLVGKCVVFNVGGNKYRVITKIDFKFQKLFIKNVLTHKEYNTDKWKVDC